MLNSQILDVAIGLAVMYLFQSILVSGINDLLISILSVRGKVLKIFLKNGLKTKENKDAIFEKFINTSFIKNLQRKNRFPGDISARNFSDAIINVIVNEATPDENILAKIKANIATMEDSQFKTIIIAKLNEAGDNYEKFKASLEEWFNDCMERTSKWYKKRITYVIYIFSFGITVFLNVDSFYVMNELWKNNKLRESVVAMSAEVTKKEYNQLIISSNPGDTTKMKQALAKINDNYQKMHMLDFPITWSYAYQLQNPNGDSIKELTFWKRFTWMCEQITFEKLLGFIITTLAVSIGAPIWYDIIRKLLSAREIIKNVTK